MKAQYKLYLITAKENNDGIVYKAACSGVNK